ncbi:hypothetical protein BGZ72_000597 [Mortierella alpina]|nr:hypothetical protein BGZ72_000597 [Mortierella alpina]
MTACPLAIPETLSIILSYVDRQTLLAASTVSKAWRDASIRVLWRSPLVRHLSPSFFSQLQRNGCHVQSLEVHLDNSKGSDSIVPTELTRLLTRMPCLRSLHVRLKEEGSSETVTALTRIIKVQVGHQLQELNLDIDTISSEDATDLFSGLVGLKKLCLTGCATAGVVNAVATSHMSQLTSITCIQTGRYFGSVHLFNNESLSALGRGPSSQLQELSAPHFMQITAAGLIGFAEHCRSLTWLDLQGCIGISSIGFETLIEASPLLTHVYFGSTCIEDAALLKFSTPPERAARLETLSVYEAVRLSTSGIASIVRSCSNLRVLNIGLCSRVTLGIFEEPAWECTGLEELSMNGIGRASTGTLEQLSDMYRQLGRLSQLRTLNLSELRFNLRLFDMGREALEQLNKMTTLKIAGLIHPPSKREIIWLTTRFRSLTVLKLDRGAVEPTLAQDLTAINGNLRILLSNKLKKLQQHYLRHDSSYSDDGPFNMEEPYYSENSSDGEISAYMDHASDMETPPSILELSAPSPIVGLSDNDGLYEDPYDTEGPYGYQDPYDSEGPYGYQDPYDTDGPYGIQDPYDSDGPYGMEHPADIYDPSDIEGPSSIASSEHGLHHMDTESDQIQPSDLGLWNYRSDKSEDSDIVAESDEEEEEESEADEGEEAQPLLSDSEQEHYISSDDDSPLSSHEPSDMNDDEDEDEELDSESRQSEDDETQYSSNSDVGSDDEEEVIESSDEQASEHSDSAEEGVGSDSDDNVESDSDVVEDLSSDDGHDDSEDDPDITEDDPDISDDGQDDSDDGQDDSDAGLEDSDAGLEDSDAGLDYSDDGLNDSDDDQDDFSEDD